MSEKKNEAPARQGDLVLELVTAVPAGAKQKPDGTLIRSSVSGHSHVVRGTATVHETEAGTQFIVAGPGAEVAHEGDMELGHKTVKLQVGRVYRVARKMQYADTGMVPVQD